MAEPEEAVPSWLIRPLEDDTLRAFDELFPTAAPSPRTLEQLKQFALLPSTSTSTQPCPATALRSIYWRCCLGTLSLPLASPDSTRAPLWALSLERTRSEWDELADRFLSGPDGKGVGDYLSTAKQARDGTLRTSPISAERLHLDLTRNNPLALDSSSPWKAWFVDMELRRMIRQDVDRTFPELAFFRDALVQDTMTDLLFVWAKLNEGIGYRQGMHEILALLYAIVDRDSLPCKSERVRAMFVLDRARVEHDTWSLFQILMRSIASFYDHTTLVPLVTHTNPGLGLTSLKDATRHVQPIVERCQRIHDRSLRAIDEQLWTHQNQLGIEPQIWGIRWLRLLLSRELPLQSVLRLWDGLFAEDPSLQLLDFVCLALLERIRDQLLAADYSSYLQALLRYPIPSDSELEVPLLLQQAILLRDNSNPTGGLTVREQNGRAGLTPHSMQVPPRRLVTSTPRPIGDAPARANELTSMSDLAKTVWSRAEAAGINKAVLSAFTEIRRNVDAYQNALATSQAAGMMQPTASVNGIRDYAAELAAHRAGNANMANALDLCTSVIERIAAPVTPNLDDPTRTSTLSSDSATSLFMTVTIMRHIRDVLKGTSSGFDASVLGPLEAVKNSLDQVQPSSMRRASPSLLLSTRDDHFATGLPRVPFSANLPDRLPPHTASPKRQSQASQTEKSTHSDPLGAI
ncbi:uncharacterized protein L969DRAFT_49974 [Mixia osmundae IAM 14324]|uniref:Rab-GAP TBC domain-containing protein n=1 Tax=Mixia osmundae (strain CBS 9802 / IAM 14324 / JCM 22182 / KY 12970) TaxID=764103 RepID=G7E6M6_MIXOS|nr:uncharacterized protein L969DRAFT_49974 [Mixia osmundae IAM 14324]KEI39136.1 hypothetical protein L969DRAFT_49974 [Mixia osmundae IAM 14324]GAA98486.1 hypothetical protein E5Q_05172 [Mixia osmundae IAM 14324]